MAYRIYQFDGLGISEYIERGDEQNIGTGSAMTSFLQLPGGGYFDNYGNLKSPQSIQPVTKTCVIWGDTQEELKDNMDALRAKLGVRGKLSVHFDDGSIRWQWARLTGVEIPRPGRAKSNWLKAELTWTTAAQHWYGTIRGDGWVWGDQSWVFGDGTAQMGDQEYIHELATSNTMTIPNGGNADVTNMAVLFEFTAGGDTLLTMRNMNNSAVIQWDGTVADGDRLSLDIGMRSVTKIPLATQKTISNIYLTGSIVQIYTTAAHGWSVGDTVLVEGTTNFNRRYLIGSVPTTTTAYAYVEPPAEAIAFSVETTGTATKLENAYSDLLVFDRQRWFHLSPGSNLLSVGATGTVDDTYVVANYFWYDHFA